MLKPLNRSSPASSPSFHYAPATRSLPASPSSRRNSKSRTQAPLPKPNVSRSPHYVDAGTQWSPALNSKMDPALTQTKLPEVPPARQPEASAPPPFTPVVATPPPPPPVSPTKPLLQPESPGLKRRQGPDLTAPTISSYQEQQIVPKRARSAQSPVKILPAEYVFCPVEDMVVLIANMISELIQTNDALPLRSGVLTRFHSRTPPGISVLDYLQRLAKHATLTPPLLLAMVYYIDRLCLLYEAFTITSLTVHRFLITAATVAAKGLSDSFWNNATYARVGGIKIAELGMLELDFLYRVDWKIVPNPETLVEYYKGLVSRAEGYEIENDTSSIDDDEEVDVDGPEVSDTLDIKPDAATDVKWKAWMDDVLTQRAEGSHEDKPA